MASELYTACFRFHLKMNTPVFLPEYKGSTFHGGFSHALEQVSPQYRKVFFSEHPGKTNPFLLIPPLTTKRHLQPGDSLQVGIIVYGVTHLFPIIFAALEKLGEKLGIGAGQGKYDLILVEELTTQGERVLFADGTWHRKWQGTALSELFALENGLDVGQVCIRTLTGIRLKNRGALQRTPPPFWLFLDRLLGRLNSLLFFYGEGEIVPVTVKKELLLAANAITLNKTETTACWREWQRPPKNGRQNMSFGSIQGDIVYNGYLTPFLPWLQIGQWIGVGGKTSFGLGLYTLVQGER